MPDRRPPHQRWIKRPPRPSRAGPPRPGYRARPGWPQALMALGFGLSAAILGAIAGPALIPRPGIGGLFAGLGLVIGFLIMWRGFGGTREDIRALFR